MIVLSQRTLRPSYGRWTTRVQRLDSDRESVVIHRQGGKNPSVPKICN